MSASNNWYCALVTSVESIQYAPEGDSIFTESGPGRRGHPPSKSPVLTASSQPPSTAKRPARTSTESWAERRTGSLRTEDESTTGADLDGKVRVSARSPQERRRRAPLPTRA